MYTIHLLIWWGFKFLNVVIYCLFPYSFSLRTYQVRSIDLLHFYPFFIFWIAQLYHLYLSHIFPILLLSFLCILYYISHAKMFFFTFIYSDPSLLCLMFLSFSSTQKCTALPQLGQIWFFPPHSPQGVLSFLYLILGPIWNLLRCMVWGMDIK